MNDKLLKRHKRQVSRAKARVKLSQPDLRTPEQLKADREASRPAGGWGNGPHALYSKRSSQNRAGPAAGAPAKADV
jgi:hypothetical protein